MSAPMTPEQVRSEALAEAATLVREHPHPGDNPAEFYAGLLADAARPRVRRFTPLEEAVQGIETAIAPLTGDAKAGADMVLAYLRTLTTPDTTVPRDLRPGAETARRMIADRQTAEDPFPGACEACGETDAQWCPDCAACRKGCHGGHDNNDCTHPNAPWQVTS